MDAMVFEPIFQRMKRMAVLKDAVDKDNPGELRRLWRWLAGHGGRKDASEKSDDAGGDHF